MRRIIASCFLLTLFSCKPAETSEDLRIPEELNALWRYEVDRLGSDTVRIGILDVLNLPKESHGGRAGVLVQERQMQLDSLQETPDRILLSKVFVQNTGDAIHQYADGPFDVLDGIFRSDVLDTLAAGDLTGDPYQEFEAYTPGWSAAFRFTESSRFSYTVLEKQRYYLDFRYEADTLSGFVEMSAFALFSGLEKISIPFDTSTIAFKMKTTLEMEFHLTKNASQTLGSFRKTVVMMSWFHPEYGLVRRTREPFQLRIPDYPTRFPIIAFPGERWNLALYLPGLAPS